MTQWKTPTLKKLANALVKISDENLMLSFLRDLCTTEELENLSNRWKAVQLLQKGTSYRTIASKTGLSTATVTRISHWLKHGEGGYEEVLKL